jgi:GNAT superfamily N-acetyltransferase
MTVSVGLPDGWRLVELTAAQTHPLRLAVLRHDTPTKQVEFPEDDWPGVHHLGVEIDGEVVATSSWVPRTFPDPEPDGWHDCIGVQLRGMATAHQVQGRGVGAALLAAGCDRARSAGVELVWANARDRVMPFYTGAGFVVVGAGFVDEGTQLPHHRIGRLLHGRTRGRHER